MKISRKLSIGTLAILAVLGAVALYAHYRLMLANEAEIFTSLGNTVGAVIEESLTHSMITRNAEVLNRTLQDFQKIDTIGRILLLNSDGVVKAGTDPEALGQRLFSLDAQKPGADLRSGPSYRWIQSIRNRKECQGCHDAKNRYNGAIVIFFSTESLERNVRARITKATSIFLGAFAGVGLFIFFFSNQIIIRRLKRATDTMERFKNGDHDARVPVRGDDEISRLGSGFNDMALSIAVSEQELKRYAEELLALAVSSNVVNAVPRTENLYEAVCSVAIKEMKLHLVWIGLVTPDSFEVKPAAQSGFEEGYLSSVKVTWDDSPSGMGPSGMALKTKTPQVMNDAAKDPRFAPWREEALKRGYCSSMAMPLLSSVGDNLGVLNFYSDQPEYFTRKRVRMLMIFSNQVATAIENRALIESIEQSRAELGRQLRIISRSQKEWQTTFDSITDMVSIHDRDFNILRANKAVRDYFGISEEDALKQKCHLVFHRSCSPHEKCPHRSSMLQRRVVTEEVRDTASGKLFRVSAFPYYSEEGEFIGSVHVARDITSEKETEMRLIMSQRLASLGQMASGVAHEINTPLASIAGCAEGLRNRIRSNRYDPVLFEQYLHIVEEEIQRCKSITNGMLSFVRTATYDQKEVRLNETLDKTLEIISFQGRLREVEIRRCYCEDLPVIYGSEGELRQVFLTVMINALDAMDNRGSLSVETGAGEGSVFVRISDTGQGIAPEHLDKIFDPFFTTKSDRGGTGLGLSIAYKIITNHGGSIAAESRKGEGSTFTVTLPLPG